MTPGWLCVSSCCDAANWPPPPAPTKSAQKGKASELLSSLNINTRQTALVKSPRAVVEPGEALLQSEHSEFVDEEREVVTKGNASDSFGLLRKAQLSSPHRLFTALDSSLFGSIWGIWAASLFTECGANRIGRGRKTGRFRCRARPFRCHQPFSIIITGTINITVG